MQRYRCGSGSRDLLGVWRRLERAGGRAYRRVLPRSSEMDRAHSAGQIAAEDRCARTRHDGSRARRDDCGCAPRDRRAARRAALADGCTRRGAFRQWLDLGQRTARWFTVVGTCLLLGLGGAAAFARLDLERHHGDRGRLEKLAKQALPAVVGSGASVSDWPQWRGRDRDGRIPVEVEFSL